MKKAICFAIAVGMMGCTGNQASSTQGALQADPTARSFGIASYVVEGDNVRMLDRYGLELGSLSLRDEADRRIIDVALTDGTTDEIEVYRPTDGRFTAPMQRDFTAGAALADAALAPLLKAHGVVFRVATAQPNTDLVVPSIVATTTSCTSPSSDLPDGCARPANTSVGCTNPSQLPAVITQDTTVSLYENAYGVTISSCAQYIKSDCALDIGGTATDWTGKVTCEFDGIVYNGYCHPRATANSWTASCPRSTCGTVGQYDAVPRLRSCYDPGSCTKSQGTVTCTAYH